jgi:hypothetical protein
VERTGGSFCVAGATSTTDTFGTTAVSPLTGVVTEGAQGRLGTETASIAWAALQALAPGLPSK